MKDVRCDRYVENLRKVRALSKPDITPEMDAQTVLGMIQHNATESFRLMKENNQLLNELVYSRKAEELTEAEVDELEEFAGALFAYANSEDVGVAYKIHCILLDVARMRNDKPFIIRELYNCGVSLHYLNIRDEGYQLNAFGDRVRGYFEEAIRYMPEYEEFDPKTRGYLIRCLGNSKMALSRNTAEEVRVYMSVFDRAMSIMTDPYYQKLDPEILWKSFIYTMNIDQLSLLPYLRYHNDPEIAERVYQAAEYVEKEMEANKGEEERLQNWRVSYFYWVAQYHVGQCTLLEAMEAMLDHVQKIASEDYSSGGVNNNLGFPAHMYQYIPLLSKEEKSVLKDRLQASRNRCMEYLAKMPSLRYPRVVGVALWNLAETQPFLDDSSCEEILQYLLAAHKPTYIHSLMVAHLTRLFVLELLKKHPEPLLGLMGYQTVEELKAHTAEIAEMAYECGLYHDVGKNSVITYVSTNARRLLDEEFTCIQLHPVFGYRLLCEVGHPDDFAQAALYHHRFYDETGGYPKDYGRCRPEMKAIVDVLNVTDSLDAATDNVGRCYTIAKPVEKLVEELRAQKGTRYAPYVVELFDDPEFAAHIREKLGELREQVYLKVYKIEAEPKTEP